MFVKKFLGALLLPLLAGPPALAQTIGYTVTVVPGTATALNQAGQITGTIVVPPFDRPYRSSHAYIWNNGAVSDLGTLGGASDRGEDLSFGRDNANTNTCGYLRLDPIPEPATPLMLLAGLGLLAWTRLRRSCARGASLQGRASC